MYVSPYLKAVAMVFAAALAGAAPYLSTGHQITQSEMVNVLLIALAAVNVFLAPNLPGSWMAYTKTIVAVVTAGAVALNTFLGANGAIAAVSPAEWAQIILTVLAAMGVYQFPNTTYAKPTASVVEPPVETPPVPVVDPPAPPPV